MLTERQTIEALSELYLRGQYLQALEQGQQLFGPIREWEGPDGRMLAARLAVNLGAPRLSLWHRLKAWREFPHEPEVRYYYGWTLLERKGPWYVWKFIQELGDMPEAPEDIRSSWYSLAAQSLSLLRDFERSEDWLRRALEVGGDRPWVHVVRSGVLEVEDRYEEALESAEIALSLISFFRPAVQSKAHLLTIMGRDKEAFEFLQEAGKHIESSAVYWHLAGIHFERDEFEALRECLRKFEEYSPLLEGHVARSFHNLRSFLAYQDGDDDEAILWARKSVDPVMHKVADRLEDPQRKQNRRVILPVGFVRQHHLTCVPATLTTLSQFWSREAEHLQVASEICYNGTTAHAERTWAEDNGWATRDFTVTEEATIALIDAGIPFTLTTTDVGLGHLQAVIGYDGRRGSLIIRDPYIRNKRELFIDGLQADYGAFGPRGMAMVPKEYASRLEPIELPDAVLWDQLHELDGALIAHQREVGSRIYEEMFTRAPEHLLTIHAQRRLAVYDCNAVEHLATVERLLEDYPENSVLQIARVSLMRNVSTRAERLEALRILTEKPNCHPAFLTQYASELSVDAREHTRAIQLIETAIRRHPGDPVNYFTYAGVLWSQQRFAEGLELYRFAACLDDKDEQFAESYFSAAQHCGQRVEVLAWLRRRFERFGDRSSLPARTLEWALTSQQRIEEALAVLDRALEVRPDDGELLLYVASVLAGTSTEYSQRAHDLLRQAEGRAPRTMWLRTAARMALLEGNRTQALEQYREVLEMQPMAVDVHQSVSRLLSEIEGEAAAVRHLRETIERFPHHQPLLVLCITWLRNEPPESVEPIVRRLIQLNPADAWAIRELGFLLLKQRRFEEAESCAEEAGRIDPKHNAYHHLRAELFAARGRMVEARREYREAVKISVDEEYTLSSLLRCCTTPAERREELLFIRDQLVNQVIHGDGLLVWRSLAHNELQPEEVLNSLEEAHRERPDLWHVWSAYINELLELNRLDQADELAREATRRFPLLPRLWLDRATISRYRGDAADELESLQIAYRINPAWGEALRALSDVYVRKGSFEEARQILEGAIMREPLDAANRGSLAEILGKLGEKEAAIEQLERAVDLAPGYNWAWDMLSQWSEELGQPERSIQAVRRLVEERPGEARSWLMLARMLDDAQFDERLQALDRAIELNPWAVDAYSQKARLLFEHGNVDAALAACRPEIWGSSPPAELLARAAWIRWESGDHQTAYKEMQSAVGEDPTIYGGWQVLADWARAMGDHPGLLNACQEMVRLAPFSEISLGYYGEALMLNQQRDAAKKVFRQAIEVQPGYEFAGNCLFDLHLEDQEWDAAEEALQILMSQSPGPYVQARLVQLATRRKNLKQATEAARRVCLSRSFNPDVWPFRTTFECMSNAGWLEQLDEVVSQAIHDPQSANHTGGLWAQVKVQLKKFEAEQELPGLVNTRPELGHQAVHYWVFQLLDTRQMKRFREFVHRNENWLRASTKCWESVIRGWSSAKCWREALLWAADWKSHPDADSWALLDVAELLRTVGRNAEGAEANHRGLALEPGQAHKLHELWLGIDESLACQYAQAAQRLNRIDPSQFDARDILLHHIVQGMCEVASALPGERQQVVEQVRKRWAEFLKTHTKLTFGPAHRIAFKKAVRLLGKHGGWLTRLWCWWKSITF